MPNVGMPERRAKRGRKLGFVQIAVAAINAEPGKPYLYGLTREGEVWQYDYQAALWGPLPMLAKVGQGQEPLKPMAASNPRGQVSRGDP